MGLALIPLDMFIVICKQWRKGETMSKASLVIVLTFLGTLVISSNNAGQTETQEQKAGTQERAEQSITERDIELTIASVEYDDPAADHVPETRYTVGEEVIIALTMTNRMGQRTVISWSDPLFQNRLKLQKDGQEVAYLPELPDKLSKMDRYGYASGSVRPIELLPNVPNRVGLLFLKEWYPPLEAGRYELRIKRRFFGNEIHSNKVTFEVVP